MTALNLKSLHSITQQLLTVNQQWGFGPLQGHTMTKEQISKDAKEIQNLDSRIIEDIKKIEEINNKKYLKIKK